MFYGDVTRPDVLKGFDIGSAEAVVVAIDDVSITNRAVMTIRKSFPDLPMIVRAKNTQHQKKLAQEFSKSHHCPISVSYRLIDIYTPFDIA